jgi:hypothetical protein
MDERKLWKALAEPFEDDEIEWRVQRCGKSSGNVWALIVPYVDARAIMNRLDTVAGVAGWSDSYSVVQTPEAGIACRLTIHRNDKLSITKEDAAECTNVSAVKGGYSDALKRAAVKFGMGRYLYGVDTVFANDIQDKRLKGGIHIYSKNDNINCWCPRPKLSEILSGNGGQKPTAQMQQSSGATAKDDLVAEVLRLLGEWANSKTVPFNVQHRKNSMKENLNTTDTEDLPKCSEKALAKYVKHLREKLA